MDFFPVALNASNARTPASGEGGAARDATVADQFLSMLQRSGLHLPGPASLAAPDVSELLALRETSHLNRERAEPSRAEPERPREDRPRDDRSRTARSGDDGRLERMREDRVREDMRAERRRSQSQEADRGPGSRDHLSSDTSKVKGAQADRPRSRPDGEPAKTARPETSTAEAPRQATDDTASPRHVDGQSQDLFAPVSMQPTQAPETFRQTQDVARPAEAPIQTRPDAPSPNDVRRPTGVEAQPQPPKTDTAREALNTVRPQGEDKPRQAFTLSPDQARALENQAQAKAQNGQNRPSPQAEQQASMLARALGPNERASVKVSVNDQSRPAQSQPLHTLTGAFATEDMGKGEGRRDGFFSDGRGSAGGQNAGSQGQGQNPAAQTPAGQTPGQAALAALQNAGQNPAQNA